jgi:hypothetical protein
MTDDIDEVLDFMSASEIGALNLSQARIEEAYRGGELAHLTVVQIGELLAEANNREMQGTILR